MGKNKNWCWKCSQKHYPLTRKKFPVNVDNLDTEKASDSVAVEESDVVQDCLSGHKVTKSLAVGGCITKTSTTKKDMFAKGYGAPGHGHPSDSVEMFKPGSSKSYRRSTAAWTQWRSR